MATTYLTRTFSSPTNRKIWTWSAWVKRQNQVSNFANALFAAYYDDNNRSVIRFNENELNFQDTANSVEIKTNRLFRDVSAWYHIVARVDTTQGTASDRVRLYVNGEQQTSFKQAAYPAQNDNMQFNGADPHYINARNSSGVDSIADMSYSHIHFTDGTAYDATAFGEYDANGVWKIIVEPSVTYGTNGFFILKDGNSVTDQSGNSNNWTVAGGTLTNTEDNPSNVFATMNPLVRTVSTPSFSQGNNTVTPNAQAYQNAFSTLGMYGSGKYYWEIKVNGSPNSANYLGISGLAEVDFLQTNGDVIGATDKGYSIAMSSGDKRTNSSNSSYGSGFANGDIMMGALDLDNGKVWWGKNGTWFNSGNPASGSNEAFSVNTSYTYLLGSGVYSGGFSSVNHNLGNGYFGTTAVASAGTNASGIGIFEYDVPTGFTALSTKGLNL